MLQVVGSIEVKQSLRTTHTALAPKLQQYAHLFSWTAFKTSLCDFVQNTGAGWKEGRETSLFLDSFIMHH